MFNVWQEFKKALAFTLLLSCTITAGYHISISIQNGYCSLFHVKELYASKFDLIIIIILFIAVIAGKMIYAYKKYNETL